MKNKIKKIFNNFINWFIIKYYSYKGWKISKNFIIGQTYYNPLKKCYGIYRGKNTFYETQQHLDDKYGIIFYDSKNKRYTNLQIGLFNLWVRDNNVKIETN